MQILFSQIIIQMENRFVKMNDAVDRIRQKVEEAWDSDLVFQKDPEDPHYEHCCEATELAPDVRFPNVSHQSIHYLSYILKLEMPTIGNSIIMNSALLS